MILEPSRMYKKLSLSESEQVFELIKKIPNLVKVRVLDEDKNEIMSLYNGKVISTDKRKIVMNFEVTAYIYMRIKFLQMIYDDTYFTKEKNGS